MDQLSAEIHLECFSIYLKFLVNNNNYQTEKPSMMFGTITKTK